MKSLMNTISSRLPLFALPLSLLVTACGDVDSSMDDSELAMEDGEAELGSAQSALCSEGVADESKVLPLQDLGSDVSSTSPSASYGTITCSGRYLVEATSTNGKPNLTATVELAEGVGQTLCAGARANMEVHGFNSATGLWTPLGTHQGSGQWVEFFPNNFHCEAGKSIAVSSTYSKIRVGAKAWTTSPSVIPRVVTGSVRTHW